MAHFWKNYRQINGEDEKTDWRYRVIRWLVWLFSPKFKVVGAANLPSDPCVIVGNHSHMYGPIAAELYTPVRHSTWCTYEMMDRKEVPAYAFQDFWSGKPKWTHWYYRLLSRMIAPLSELIFTNAHTVPVYYDARVRGTFRETEKQLESGSSIVIFPERYEVRNNIINSFQDHFVDFARLYFRKTGKELSFVPMYLAPALKTVYYGEPVTFDSGNDLEDERVRICESLMDSITDIAVSLPKHRVVPYPNIPKSQYKYNIPLEVYDKR